MCRWNCTNKPEKEQDAVRKPLKPGKSQIPESARSCEDRREYGAVLQSLQLWGLIVYLPVGVREFAHSHNVRQKFVGKWTFFRRLAAMHRPVSFDLTGKRSRCCRFVIQATPTNLWAVNFRRSVCRPPVILKFNRESNLAA